MAGRKSEKKMRGSPSANIVQQQGQRRASAPEPEVLATAKRRKFSASYKLEVLQQADACREPGQIGELLRREGLYSSHLSKWREQRDAGALRALGVKRGRKAKPVDPDKKRLERENERLRRQLDQAEKIIEIQKKVSELLGVTLPSDDNGEQS
jgi:transposase-like protein